MARGAGESGDRAEQKRERLIALGADSLADILLSAAEWNEDVMNRVERAIASPAENTKRFRAKLSGLKRRKGFIHWRQSGGFARELEGLLEDLRSGVEDPKVGLKLVAAFFEADDTVFHLCDDSAGNIGDVFRHDAANLFVHYASRCEEKDWLCDMIVKLLRDDGFGVRDSVVRLAAEYLPESDMRRLVDRFWGLAEETGDKDRGRHWIYMIEYLARQLRDPALYEKASRAAWPELSTASCIDIAEVYLESDNARTALAWLERVPDGETFKASERDQLLSRVYEQLGEHEKLTEVMWRRFRSHRSKATFDELLAVVGEDRRDDVVEESVRAIRDADRVSYSAASFLIDIGCVDEAEQYLIRRVVELNGELYTSLLPLARAMEADSRGLAATVCFRALLDSILQRGISKYYHHGVRYLRKLDDLAPSILDWQDVPAHTTYADGLRQTHGRKSSFWSRYGA